MYQYMYQYMYCMYHVNQCISTCITTFISTCISTCINISHVSIYLMYQYISCTNVSMHQCINVSMYQYINHVYFIDSFYNFLFIELSRLAPLRRPRPFPLFPPITFPITFPISSIPFSSFIFTRTITAARPKPTFPPNNKLIKGRLAR